MQRTWAIVEREMRRFRRSPMLIVMSMVMPIVQLVVLGYAFGGNVKHLKLAVVDQDRGVPAVRIRELAGRVAAGARTFETGRVQRSGRGPDDLRNGRINGVLTIPPDFSRRALSRQRAAHRARSPTTPTTSFRRSMAATSVACIGAFNAPRDDRAGAGQKRGSTSSKSIRTCRTCSTCCPVRSSCRSS